ncbi:hypothetical protein [Fusobacterium varium]
MENKVKIYKKDNKVVKIVLNGQVIEGVTKIKINNDYTPQNSNESIVIEISDVSLLEIVSD